MPLRSNDKLRIRSSPDRLLLNTGQPSGCLEEFQNTLPQVGYYAGTTVASKDSFGLESWEGLDTGIMNQGDINLADVAAQIGADFRSGAISMDDVEGRSEVLCQQ